MGTLHERRNGPLRYLVSVPETHGSPAPVIVFLHGYDEGSPADLLDVARRHGPLRERNPARPAARFIIVAPQLPIRGDLWHLFGEEVLAITTTTIETEAGDPRRVYLTGFSYGGNGAFDLALQQPNAWTALWPVDPTRVPRRDPGCPIWLSIGAAARPGERAFVDALRLHPADERAAQDRIYLDEGADHAESAALAYQDVRIYEWLLAKARPDLPE